MNNLYSNQIKKKMNLSLTIFNRENSMELVVVKLLDSLATLFIKIVWHLDGMDSSNRRVKGNSIKSIFFFVNKFHSR